MTIKELEERTGMTRANIRYYESEGLIAPKRLDNGYRDYSEEDARTLEKVKLLRELRLDIDTIRLVQKGELTLEQALFTLLTRLEGDKAAIGRAVEVCRELEKSGVEYGALDPKPWLDRLEPPVQPQLSPGPQCVQQYDLSPEDHAARAYYHPWRRWLARGIDVTVCSSVIGVVLLIFFREQAVITGGSLLSWVLQFIWMIVTFVIVEPLCLHYWGWTPGKWIFGLKLRDQNGEKLSVSDARRRSWRVFSEGYGYQIPLLNLWRMWKTYQYSADNRDCPWDSYEGYRYTCEPRRLCGLWWAVINAVCTAVLVLAFMQSNLPPNRGDLTVAEFAKNYNTYLHRYGPNLTDDMRLDREGNWVEALGYNHYGGEDGSVTWHPLEFELVDGHISSVTISWEGDYWAIWNWSSPHSLALEALSGSGEQVNLFNYDPAGWRGFWSDSGLPAWEDGEVDYRGLRITQQAYYEGYEQKLYGEGLTAIDGEDRYFSKTVTITIIGSD